MVAYAVPISEANFQAIASEKPDFDLDETIKWLDDHGSGFFLRDPENPTFDCKYFVDEVFSQLYMFETADRTAIFIRVLRL